ncbi:MAG: sensor histidine kinase [Pseudomonadota bacterium]
MLADMPGRRSLTVQILFLLSLALLPLGAIAAWQTQRISVQAESQLQTALLLQTERTTGKTRYVAERGLGALRALQAMSGPLFDDVGLCSEILADFALASDNLDAFRFIGIDGATICSSDAQVRWLEAVLPTFIAAPDDEPRLRIVRTDPEADRYTLSMTQPVYDDDGALRGQISVMIRDADLSVPSIGPTTKEPYGLVTFDADGQILTTTFDEDETAANLPAGLDLQLLAGEPARVFHADTQTGLNRAFAVVPIMPGMAYAMASWPPDALFDDRFDHLAADALLPMLMWVATLLVAFIALERLVLRHVRVLSRQMRTFARTRRLIARPVLGGAAFELAAIETDFRNMAESILQDEAQLEDNLREKNILLKEVHHRVKNNLQLITSIMNMQLRRVNGDEARIILQRLHERIMGIALVHRALYQSPEINKIDAAAVVVSLGSKIVDATGRAGRVKLRPKVEPVELFPEQAVPLALLVTEALTNAIEHAAPDEHGEIEIRLDFSAEGRHATLLIESAAEAVVENKSTGTEPGLGHQLIRAFETQLGGSLSMGQLDDRYHVQIKFPIRTQHSDPRDY